ncbi:MAG: ribosomal protein S18-alanine N-acetyltransferase [Candidatus Latescibacterota bacterium]|nr:MAG: ribosomal protein S18-alanine N-acetyltransferase [Candidatus Latescibacterota bacterium]
MTDIKIEPMNQGHLPQILAIEKAVFPAPWPPSMFEGELKRRNTAWGLRSFSIVAVDGDEVIGYAIGWFLEDEVHLVNIAVKESHQAHGVGSLLLRRVIEEARDSGKRFITLEVRASNVGAQEFYTRFMFRIVGVRPGYYSDNREDAVLMTLDLEPVTRRRTNRRRFDISDT